MKGAIQPVEAIAAAARGQPVSTPTPRRLRESPGQGSRPAVDYATVVGHKIGAPKGVAALYVRDGAPFAKLMHGGGQEGGRRAGTGERAAVVGLGAAALVEDEADRLPSYMSACVAELRRRLEAELGGEGGDGIRVNGPEDAADRLPNTLSVGVAGSAQRVAGLCPRRWRRPLARATREKRRRRWAGCFARCASRTNTPWAPSDCPWGDTQPSRTSRLEPRRSSPPPRRNAKKSQPCRRANDRGGASGTSPRRSSDRGVIHAEAERYPRTVASPRRRERRVWDPREFNATRAGVSPTVHIYYGIIRDITFVRTRDDSYSYMRSDATRSSISSSSFRRRPRRFGAAPLRPLVTTGSQSSSDASFSSSPAPPASLASGSQVRTPSRASLPPARRRARGRPPRRL